MRARDAKTDGRQNSRPVAKWLTGALLQAASDGKLFLYGTRRYPRVAISQGMEGLRRIAEEERFRKLRRRIRDLKRRGLLEARRRGGRLLLVCTAQGEAARLRHALKTSPLRTDGFRTLVAFDIPESQRHVRAAFRDLLRAIGCRRLQGSVWISDKCIAEKLHLWTRRSKLDGWIRIFSIREP